MRVKVISAIVLAALLSAGAFAQTAGGNAGGQAGSAAGQVEKPAGEVPQERDAAALQQEQDDRAAAAARSMARSRHGKVTEGVSPKAMMYFIHKCNSKYDTQMTLNRVGNLYRLMPRKLKREIGQIYYPALREGLQEKDEMKFLEADAGKKVLEDGTLQINLSFPKFYLTMDHVNWADLDQLFLTYFK